MREAKDTSDVREIVTTIKIAHIRLYIGSDLLYEIINLYHGAIVDNLSFWGCWRFLVDALNTE